MNTLYRRLAIPYQIWLVMLVFLPIMAVILIAISNVATSNFDLSDYTISFSHWNALFANQSSTPDQTYINSYQTAFFNSLKYASITTVLSFVFGYFLAYQISRSRIKNKFIVLTIVILPMWTNLILRSEALRNLMQESNIIQSLLGFNILPTVYGTDLVWIGVVIGLLLTYMPFMILPIYTALEKIDVALGEASLDLGLTPFKTFWKVTFPMSLKGVVSGSIMVFLPTFAGFAVPNILSGNNVLMIGSVIEKRFIYPALNMGSLLAFLVLILILGSIFILNRFDKEGETLL